MVTLTLSETRAGTAYADALSGGSTGIAYGQCTNGAYAPLIDQATNDGRKVVYIRHDAAYDPITSLRVFAAQYSGTYGGQHTAAADFTLLKNEGFASAGTDPKNLDGASAGLHVDMDWDVSQSNQFNPSRIFTGGGTGAFVAVFGDGVSGPTDGIDLSSAITIKACAMTKDGGGGVDAAPSAAEDGKIGKAGDATLGDRALTYWRYYIATSSTTGGVQQFDVGFAYSFTA